MHNEVIIGNEASA